jgi:4-amino-4-deoxy-L-arabinose transferase-like glycosyltransferase
MDDGRPRLAEVSVIQPPSSIDRRRALPTVRALLGLILLAYVALAAGYAVLTPRWNNPDEPAHFNYVREVAETGRLPVIRAGDWDADLLERLKATRFPRDASIDAIRYEGHQPPLYYLLAAPLHRLTGGLPLGAQVLVLRGLSIVLGAIVVASAFAVGRQLCPHRPAIALLAAATAAFVPMHTAISAAINNDSLANALAALTCVALVVGARRGFDDRAAVLLGGLLGALILTKLTVYVYVPLALFTVTLSEIDLTRRCKRPIRWSVLRRPALAAATAAAISAWWLVRNVGLYGWSDPLAVGRHAEVVVGQPRWQQLDAAAVDYFGRILFRSFWGQFGWMGVVLSDRVYLLYLALTVLAALGLALLGFAHRGRRIADPAGATPMGPDWTGWVLAAAALLVAAEVVVYNLTFIQPQGRYLFPALVPIVLGLSLGWSRLAQPVGDGRPYRALPAVILAAAAAWALLEALGPLLDENPWSEPFVASAVVGLSAVLLFAGRLRDAVRPNGVLVALAVGLGLLDLASLLRFVAPAFR